MDLSLGDTDLAVIDAARRIFRGLPVDGAGPEPSPRAVLGVLGAHGYLDLLHDAGPLTAELVVEEAARAGVSAPLPARMLVAPGLLPDLGPASLGTAAIALASADRPLAPVRFGAQADLVLVLSDDHVVVAEPRRADIEEVDSPFGYPLARIHSLAGRRLRAGTGPLMLAWWRVALAAEAAGCMETAIEMTLRHAREREMFGTRLGSFQAVRHRLSEGHVHAQAAKWLAREAAWSGTDAVRAASAAAYAADAAKAVLDDCHQFHGAMGLTREHPLHRWTLRLQALRTELGGARRHERDLAAMAWP
jgi:hypothetical protein